MLWFRSWIVKSGKQRFRLTWKRARPILTHRGIKWDYNPVLTPCRGKKKRPKPRRRRKYFRRRRRSRR